MILCVHVADLRSMHCQLGFSKAGRLDFEWTHHRELDHSTCRGPQAVRVREYRLERQQSACVNDTSLLLGYGVLPQLAQLPAITTSPELYYSLDLISSIWERTSRCLLRGHFPQLHVACLVSAGEHPAAGAHPAGTGGGPYDLPGSGCCRRRGGFLLRVRVWCHCQ